MPKIWRTLFFTAVVLCATTVANAQTSTTPSTVELYSTVYSIGLEWTIVGDTNHNATASLNYREEGGAWRVGLPLVRFEGSGANVLAGSVFYLTPGTRYEVQAALSDPDGGSATESRFIETKPEPSLPLNGRVLHVVAAATGGGSGSQADPYRGIGTAQAAAMPGDILLLHQGSYGPVEFSKAGSPGQYIVWLTAGDGEVRLDTVDVSASYVWLEGLVIRNQTYGVRSIAAPSNVVIRRMALLGNHHSIVLTQRGDSWFITDNTIVGDTPFWTESLDGEGIDLNGSSGHTVAHNSITNVADGISGPLANVDIFGNDIFDTSDDGIEPDGGWINVRIWGNRIHNAVHNAISFQPQAGGPWYILRNQIVGSVESPFKFRQTDRFVMLHNTIVGWGNAYPGDALMCCNEDHLLRGITRNNLWINVQGGELWGFDTGGVIDWRTNLDYDGFDWGAHPSPFVYAGVSYANIAALTAGTGLEAHGIRIFRQTCFETFNVPNPPPAPVPPQVMTLANACPAVDAGALLPNVNGTFTGAGPDMGAVERGLPLPTFGPREVPTAQLIAAPGAIAAGGSSTLSWTTTTGTRATILPTIGHVLEIGSTTVSPSETTTYVLVAELPGGAVLKLTTVSVLPFSGGPFQGVTPPVPGIVEAERFNEGGANVAYRDLSPGNEGGLFRSTDVDLEATKDVSGEFNLGWVLAGEWVSYTVAVGATANYTLDTRVAADGGGGVFHIEIDGVDKTGPIAVPDTGGWQRWTTARRMHVGVQAGQHVMRLVMDANGSSGFVGNFNWIRWILEEPGGSIPFEGTPAVVPGTIEFERFNDGGAEVAYRDLSPGNDGGAFRDTDVDIELTGDTTGEFNVGWTRAGEWLLYSANIAAGGLYTLDVRVAAEGGGAVFHLEVDGFDRTGPIVVPNTGSWQTWATIRRSGVPLGAGSHVLRLVMDANGSSGWVGNFNWMQWAYEPVFGTTPYGGIPASVPGTIEVERFDEGGQLIAYRDLSAENEGGAFRGPGVDIEQTTDVSGDFNVGWTLAGEWLLYTVDVATSGNYTLDLRVAVEGGGGTFHVEVDNVDATGPVVVPDTGSWQAWTTVSRTGVALTAGRHFVRLAMDANGSSGWVGNFNWIRWTLETSGGSTPFGGIPASVPGTIEVERFDEGGQLIAYRDLSPENEGGAFRGPGVDIEQTTDVSGDFNVGWTLAGEWLLYTVDVVTNGTYTLDMRVAVEGGGGTFHVEVDGVDATGPVVVPDTGSWQGWTTITRTGIPLTAGRHFMRLAMDTNGSSGWIGNFNWIRWTRQTP